jgi:hypothetical protein
MEIPYFDYYLKGEGQPFPKILVEASSDPMKARFRVKSPSLVQKAEIY